MKLQRLLEVCKRNRLVLRAEFAVPYTLFVVDGEFLDFIDARRDSPEEAAAFLLETLHQEGYR